MKKRMITLLLALVLVISLLPAVSAADVTFTVTMRGLRYGPNISVSGFTYISQCAVVKTLHCDRCKSDPDHNSRHAAAISEVKDYFADMQAKVAECVENQKMIVVGLTTEIPHDASPANVRLFNDSGDIELQPYQGGETRQIYFVAIPYSVKVDVNCISESEHTTTEYDLKTESIKSVTTGKSSIEGTFTCQLVIDKAPYIAEYNKANGTHRNADAEETLTLDLTYSNRTGEWTCANAQINVKCEPDAPDADFWSFNDAVEVSCTTTAGHAKQTYGLLAGTYETGEVTKNAAGDYTVTGTITDPAAYVGEFSKDHNKLHVEDAGSTYTFAAKWDKDSERWERTDRAQIAARCEPDAPTVDTIEGLAAVKVDCIADETHKDETYALVKDTYILGEPAFEDGKYVLTGKVNVPDGYVKAYADAHGAHELDKDNSPATFKLVWNAELGEWELKELALIAVRCESAYNPTAPILAGLNKTAPKLNTRDHFAYVQGYPDGTVRPSGSVTRAETAAILFRLMDASSRSLYYATAAGFRDVDSTKWYNTYVATLNNAGVITDSRDGYFRPDAAITRAELAAMLAQFAEQKSAAIYFSDVSAGYWAAKAIALTADLGWINGYPDGTFGPDKTVTRAELMAMINRATGRAPKSADALLTGMKTWKDNANTGAWYYLDVQEATNSHSYMVNLTEYWTGLEADPNWAQYE